MVEFRLKLGDRIATWTDDLHIQRLTFAGVKSRLLQIASTLFLWENAESST